MMAILFPLARKNTASILNASCTWGSSNQRGVGDSIPNLHDIALSKPMDANSPIFPACLTSEGAFDTFGHTLCLLGAEDRKMVALDWQSITRRDSMADRALQIIYMPK